MKTTIFVTQLPKEAQEDIKKTVYNTLLFDGYRGKALRLIVGNAMCERLCNLSDVVDIEALNNKYDLALELQFIICIKVPLFCVLMYEKVTIKSESWSNGDLIRFES